MSKSKQSIDNREKVNKQINIGNVFGNIDSKIKEDEFTDPTQLLPEKPCHLPVFGYPNKINKYFVKLKKERVVLIDSFYEDIARSISYDLVKKAQNEGYVARFLALENKKYNEEIVSSLDKLDNEKISKKRKLIILISLKSEYFLDSIFYEESLKGFSIKQKFTKNNILIVCFSNTSFIKDIWKNKKDQFYFFRKSIDFLPFLLKDYFDKNTAKILRKKLLKQKKNKLWGGNDDESEFYKIICENLSNDIHEFKEKINKREEFKSEEDPKEFLKSIRIIPKELITDNIIKNTVLYVSTFFKNLNSDDFDFMVCLLLKDEVVKKRDKSLEKNKKHKKYKKIYREQKCIDIWKKDKNKILKKCYLTIRQKENSSFVIDFTLIDLREALKDHLVTEYLYMDLFKKIDERGLLFDFDCSSQIIKNVIELSANIGIYNSNYYNKIWLIEVVCTIEKRIIKIRNSLINELEESNIIIDLTKQQLTLNNSQKFIENEIEKIAQETKEQNGKILEVHYKEAQQEFRYIIARLTELIREILQYPEQKIIIKNFLEQLIKDKHHDILLIIIDELKFSSNFDDMYWIEQLINRGTLEAKENVYRHLLLKAKRSGSKIYELIDLIILWLPANQINENNSPKSKYSLKFIIDYSRQTLKKFKAEYYGVFPPKYYLFSNIKTTDYLYKIDKIVSWVFNKNMKMALIYLNDDFFKGSNKRDDINILLADLIGIWFTILYGLHPKNTCSESVQVSDYLLKQVILNTNRIQQVTLTKRWIENQKFITKRIKSLSITKRKERKKLLMNKYDKKQHLINERIEKNNLIHERKVSIILSSKFKQLRREAS